MLPIKKPTSQIAFLLETIISEHQVQVSVFFLIACDSIQNLITTWTTIFPYTVKILFTHVLGAAVASSNNLITISCITIFPPLSKSFSSFFSMDKFFFIHILSKELSLPIKNKKSQFFFFKFYAASSIFSN